MARLHQQQPTRRAAMSIAAALCVLGFASLVFLHDAASPSIAASAPPRFVGNFPVAGDAQTSATTGLPSAESVFRGTPYKVPEEAIAQF